MWLDKDSATLKEIQSLIGKLSFVCATVRSGRVFIARILEFVKIVKLGQPRRILVSMKKNLCWWDRFLTQFNGITMMPDLCWCRLDSILSSDSCLVGCGVWFQGWFLHAPFPHFILDQKNAHINELECLAIIVAIKMWGKTLSNRNLLMYCDNQVTVETVNHGQAKNVFAQACLRELIWLSASHNLWIKLCYVESKQNSISDCLSRWNVDHRCQEEFFKLTEGWELRETVVPDSAFAFTHDW